MLVISSGRTLTYPVKFLKVLEKTLSSVWDYPNSSRIPLYMLDLPSFYPSTFIFAREDGNFPSVYRHIEMERQTYL